MIPNAAQPKFILSRHSNTVTDKEGSSSEIESVIITEGVHKLLDTFKENYPKQHQLAKNPIVLQEEQLRDKLNT